MASLHSSHCVFLEHDPVHEAQENTDQIRGEQVQEHPAAESAQQEPRESEVQSAREDGQERQQEEHDENQTADGLIPKSAPEGLAERETGAQQSQQDESDDAQEEDVDSPYENSEQEDYTEENALNADGDVLDADEVHQSADAEEGGDYVDEKDVAPEDDEQHFGEDLPEDFGGETEGDAEERQTLDGVVEGDADGADLVPSEGIDVLETPAFLGGDFTTIPEDQYDAGMSTLAVAMIWLHCTQRESSEQRDEDGFTDTGETLPTDMSAPSQEDNGMYHLIRPENVTKTLHCRARDHRCRGY